MRKELIEELEIKKAELSEKAKSLQEELENVYEALDAVELLMTNGAILRGREQKGGKIKKQAIGVPKGNFSWDDYAKLILKEVGGRGKSSDVIEYAKKANPKIKEKTLRETLRGTLSKLGTAGQIRVEKAAIKSEGNTYEFNQ